MDNTLIMKYVYTIIIAALLLLIGASQCLLAQESPSRYQVDRPWYVGLEGGTSFGQCTFRSITEYGIHWGAQGGLTVGYRFNRIFSLEAGAKYGGQAQSALDCCTYWLSEDGIRHATPVLDGAGWLYHDLESTTQWGRVALQANLDLLSLFTGPDCRWSLNVGPQVSAVTTKTRIIAPDKEMPYGRQWHLGLGGQASLGLLATRTLGVALYGGITCLTGERFDNMPEHAHKSNLIWDTGLKLTFNLGRGVKKAPVVDTSAADEAARLAAEKAEQERLAAEKAEQERLAAEQAALEKARLEKARLEEAERLAREEEARREAAEAAEAAARKDQAFKTPIPVVYFANNSDVVEKGYDPLLEAALDILNRYPDFNLEIHSYCSKSGTKEHNDRLSKQRTEALQNWFASRGIAPERMEKAFHHGIDYDAPSAEKARRSELWFVK